MMVISAQGNNIIYRRISRIPYARNGNVGRSIPEYTWDVFTEDGRPIMRNCRTLREAKTYATKALSHRPQRRSGTPMIFASAGDFIQNHIRFGQHWNKKYIGLLDAKWQTLQQDTWLDGCVYAAGSAFKVFETTNFGWIVFQRGTQSPNGTIPMKRMVKW